jgi:hypothetical protein
MTASLFYKYLVYITVGCSALFSILHLAFHPIRQHWPLSVLTLSAFVLLSLGLFWTGSKTVKSTNKGAFNGLITGSVFGKMILAVGLLYIYQQLWKPDNEWFVAIFLFSYLIYTIFEVWFMTKLARQS